MLTGTCEDAQQSKATDKAPPPRLLTPAAAEEHAPASAASHHPLSIDKRIYQFSDGSKVAFDTEYAELYRQKPSSEGQGRVLMVRPSDA